MCYTLTDILNSKELNQYINALFYNAYNRYSLRKYIEYEDYKQEEYLYLINALEKYDSTLASIKSYLFSCIYNKAFNLFRCATTKGRKDDKETISLNVAYKELNKKYDMIEGLEDDYNFEDDILFSDLYNFILNRHKDDVLYKIILDMLIQGYSKFYISKEIKKTRPVVERRVLKIKEDIKCYLRSVNNV